MCRVTIAHKFWTIGRGNVGRLWHRCEPAIRNFFPCGVNICPFISTFFVSFCGWVQIKDNFSRNTCIPWSFGTSPYRSVSAILPLFSLPPGAPSLSSLLQRRPWRLPATNCLVNLSRNLPQVPIGWFLVESAYNGWFLWGTAMFQRGFGRWQNAQ